MGWKEDSKYTYNHILNILIPVINRRFTRQWDYTSNNHQKNINTLGQAKYDASMLNLLGAV